MKGKISPEGKALLLHAKNKYKKCKTGEESFQKCLYKIYFKIVLEKKEQSVDAALNLLKRGVTPRDMLFGVFKQTELKGRFFVESRGITRRIRAQIKQFEAQLATMSSSSASASSHLPASAPQPR